MHLAAAKKTQSSRKPRMTPIESTLSALIAHGARFNVHVNQVNIPKPDRKKDPNGKFMPGKYLVAAESIPALETFVTYGPNAARKAERCPFSGIIPQDFKAKLETRLNDILNMNERTGYM